MNSLKSRPCRGNVTGVESLCLCFDGVRRKRFSDTTSTGGGLHSCEHFACTDSLYSPPLRRVSSGLYAFTSSGSHSERRHCTRSTGRPLSSRTRRTDGSSPTNDAARRLKHASHSDGKSTNKTSSSSTSSGAELAGSNLPPGSNKRFGAQGLPALEVADCTLSCCCCCCRPKEPVKTLRMLNLNFPCFSLDRGASSSVSKSEPTCAHTAEYKSSPVVRSGTTRNTKGRPKSSHRSGFTKKRSTLTCTRRHTSTSAGLSRSRRTDPSAGDAVHTVPLSSSRHSTTTSDSTATTTTLAISFTSDSFTTTAAAFSILCPKKLDTGVCSSSAFKTAPRLTTARRHDSPLQTSTLSPSVSGVGCGKGGDPTRNT
mmetsp:Transcript_11199/g.19016  ORF Transcript_11199/g.19016 Transcript_11199/m.19016 type:complete len:369 (-) Transcript_11199:123-1229(-)